MGGVIGVSAGASPAIGTWKAPEAQREARAIDAPSDVAADRAEPDRAHGRPLAVGARRAERALEKEGDEEGPRSSEGVWDLAATDLDGDERPDLVLVTGGPASLTGTVSLLFDPGADVPPSSWPSVTFDTQGDYGRVAVGDINGDGIEDVAALTFGTHLLRWWLLDRDHSVIDERSLSFAGAPLVGGVEAALTGAVGAPLAGGVAAMPASGIVAPLAGGVCPGARESSFPPPTLSSLAFADLDVDGALELAVTAYAGAGEGSLYLLSYRRASGCFELAPGFARATRGSLKVRFFDVDDDGALDIVTSHYSLSRPSGPAPACGGDCLEWGEWWRSQAVLATPLLARFEDRELGASEPAPELNVVDFDALRTAAGVRFALAGSAHLCPALDCWSEGQAGFVSVVDGSGRQLASSDGWKQRVEQTSPVDEARLLPRVVSFFGELERPSLAAGYWWATRSKNSACSRVNACAGPLTAARAESEPYVLGESTFAQALGVLSMPGAAVEHRLHCEPSRPLITLPDTSITAIVELRLRGRRLPASAYAWMPGGRVIALSAGAARDGGQVCVRYAKSSRERLAVADSKQGLLVIPLE